MVCAERKVYLVECSLNLVEGSLNQLFQALSKVPSAVLSHMSYLYMFEPTYH